VFAISDPVIVEGQTLAAGKYGVHFIPGQEEWTVIFSRNAGQWGSFFYDPADDALRVNVKPAKHEYREWLAYEFPVRKPTEARLELQWEELAVPLNLKVDNVNDIYISDLRQQLTSASAFDARAYDAAAQFCVNANTHLDQGLKWADTAINLPFVGEKSFNTLSTKALVLTKMGKGQEAKAIMEGAIKLPATTALEIHQYGRTLIAMKRNKEALDVFKYNQERNGDAWPIHVGLARGYAAVGDTKQALEHAQKALTQAPDALNKQSLEAMVKTLSSGQNISQ
jgi:tetratricopeptide (TPR) repeat protein